MKTLILSLVLTTVIVVRFQPVRAQYMREDSIFSIHPDKLYFQYGIVRDSVQEILRTYSFEGVPPLFFQDSFSLPLFSRLIISDWNMKQKIKALFRKSISPCITWVSLIPGSRHCRIEYRFRTWYGEDQVIEIVAIEQSNREQAQEFTK